MLQRRGKSRLHAPTGPRLDQTVTNPARYRREKDEYLRLVELDAAARDTALQALAGHEPDLAAALRRMFEADAGALNCLDVAAEPTPQLPRYRLIREIGRGGMGRVWLAERNDGGFHGQVAIKQIDRETWSATDERRFMRERQILASLDHPYIARLIDGGSDGNGRPFLATWYIDGTRITTYCEQQALSPRARVALLRKVGDAVAYAHRQLVVHRDIKPANILVDTDGEPRLLDFGIARMLDEDTAATAAGASPLTLRYAAPEQIRGETAGVAADVHALGCLMYELLAGEPPHAQAGTAALMHAILHDDPPPPSAVARRLGRTAPDGDLDAICLRALRKRAEERYRSVDDWNADIDRALAGEPVHARRGERGYAARRWLRRRWPWLAAAGLLAGIVTYHLLSIERQLAAVARERDRASELADLVTRVYRAAEPAEIRDGNVSALALLDRAAAELDDESSGTLTAQGRAALIASLGEVYYELGLRERSQQQFERAVQIAQRIDPPPADDIAEYTISIARALNDLGKPLDALRWSEGAIARRSGEGDGGSTLSSLLHHSAAASYAALDEFERAGEHNAKAIAILENNLPQLRDDLAVTLSNAANLELQRGGLEQADRYLARARELLDPDNSLFYRSDLYLRRLLGRVRHAQGRRDEGLQIAGAALADARRRFGAQHPDVIVFAGDYASLLLQEERLDETGAVLDEALAIGRAAGSGSARRVLGIRGTRGRWLIARGEYAAAVRELETVAAERAKTPQRDRRIAAHERAALAYARCRSGELAGSAELDTAIAEAQVLRADSRPGVAADFARWRSECAPRAAAGAYSATLTRPDTGSAAE